ncbi:MAG: hypothetical protein R3250_16550, partial [Melioribacteraceae bacterium]|nr:hypothetical protein [Melioribacteraceae bacterium]
MNRTIISLIALLLAFSLFYCSNEEEDTADPVEEDQIFSVTEIEVYNWFENQQLANGLLESVEDGNVVSLYDNALA